MLTKLGHRALRHAMTSRKAESIEISSDADVEFRSQQEADSGAGDVSQGNQETKVVRYQ